MYKRDIAKLILQEIRFAEQLLRTAKDNDYNYYLANKLLPTNSWNKNIHLFVKDLSETEIDLVSKFYSNVSYIDSIINFISSFKNNQLIEMGGVSSEGEVTMEVREEKKLKIKKQFELNASNILKDVSEKVEFIYNTPAADKLRKIYEKKWYQILSY